MAEAPTIHFADSSVMLATWRSIAIIVFGHAPATVPGVQAIGRGLEAYGRKLGLGRMLEISLIDDHSGLPDGPVRDAMDAMVPRVAPYYASSIVVFGGAGFRAAMIRGIVTSFQFLSRAKYAQGVFATRQDAVAFTLEVAKKTGAFHCDPAELSAALEAVAAEAVRRDIFTKPAVARPATVPLR